jgi:hypothetical protein
MRRLLAILALLWLGSGCDTPEKHEYAQLTGLIKGTVLYPSGTARGNVAIFLFKTSDPPPPQGSGRPINFVIVSRNDLFGDVADGVVADFSAPFTIPTVPEGDYTIRAFLDAAGRFNPFSDYLNQPVAGDVAGGYVDRSTLQFNVVSVKAGQVSESSILVTLGLPVPVERPVFAVSSTTTFALPLRAPASLTLVSHPIQRPPLFTMDPAHSQFLVQYASYDPMKGPAQFDGSHLPDVYPHVILQKLGDTRKILIPGITNPFPFLDRLAGGRTATTTVLEVILPPVAFEQAMDGSLSPLPDVPAGSYSINVLEGTSQTWTVPNDIDQALPGSDPTQSASVQINPAPAGAPSGTISGKLRVLAGPPADAYVFAFSALDPPPPAGTGRPLGAAAVPKEQFAATSSATREAPFSISSLPGGSYVLVAVLDVRNDLSPLVDLVSQPSAGDVLGSSSQPIMLADHGSATNVVVVLSTVLPFERPSFAVTSPDVPFPRTGAPFSIDLVTHPIDVLAQMPMHLAFPVTLDPVGDADGDNLPDLLPKILLTKIPDGGDARSAADVAPPLVIPALLDPFPFLDVLASGTPVVPVDHLRVVVPPIAVQLSAGGMKSLVAPPPGRYRINLLSPFGQTWSVPNDVDLVLGRVGTTAEDPTQARSLVLDSNPIPLGAVAGTIAFVGGPMPASADWQVVLLAFSKLAPPPPRGAGRPVASTVVPKAEFGGAATAPYVLAGLNSGIYTIVAFVDLNKNFTPWFDTLNQPDNGDLPGGHLQLPTGTLLEVMVNALQSPTPSVDVTILPTTPYRFDRPVFSLSPTTPVMHRMTGTPLVVPIGAQLASSPLLRANPRFPIQWVDLDGDGTADDINGDGAPDTFPIVIAELLDPNDPTNLTLAQTPFQIPGIVDPTQFVPAGFPAMTPTATTTVVPVASMIVAFPPAGVDPVSGMRGAPPLGHYRITLIDGSGQTWTIPNALSLAAGEPLAASQAGTLVVAD